MEYRELVELIPTDVRNELSESLIDILLEGEQTYDIPPSVAKTILHYWQRNQLGSRAGLTNLLKATYEAAPEITLNIIEGYNLNELKIALKPA